MCKFEIAWGRIPKRALPSLKLDGVLEEAELPHRHVNLQAMEGQLWELVWAKLRPRENRYLDGSSDYGLRGI